MAFRRQTYAGLALGTTVCFIGIALGLLFDDPFLLYGALLASLGSTLNLIVVSMNKGRMPVRASEKLWEELDTKPIYVRMNQETKLAWLGDYFNVRDTFIFSIGDLVAAIGALLCLFGFASTIPNTLRLLLQ